MGFRHGLRSLRHLKRPIKPQFFSHTRKNPRLPWPANSVTLLSEPQFGQRCLCCITWEPRSAVLAFFSAIFYPPFTVGELMEAG
jgi:hypothetical protein